MARKEPPFLALLGIMGKSVLNEQGTPINAQPDPVTGRRTSGKRILRFWWSRRGFQTFCRCQ